MISTDTGSAAVLLIHYFNANDCYILTISTCICVIGYGKKLTESTQHSVNCSVRGIYEGKKSFIYGLSFLCRQTNTFDIFYAEIIDCFTVDFYCCKIFVDYLQQKGKLNRCPSLCWLIVVACSTRMENMSRFLKFVVAPIIYVSTICFSDMFC